MNHYITLKQTELDSALNNVTVNVTKEDMDEILTTVLTKISEECKDGGCIFTEPLQTMATESFGRDKININMILNFFHFVIKRINMLLWK